MASYDDDFEPSPSYDSDFETAPVSAAPSDVSGAVSFTPAQGFDATPARRSRQLPRIPEQQEQPGFFGSLKQGLGEVRESVIDAPIRAASDLNDASMSLVGRLPEVARRAMSGGGMHSLAALSEDPDVVQPGPRMRSARPIETQGFSMAPDTGFRRLPRVENIETPAVEGLLSAAQEGGPVLAAPFPGALPAMGAAGLGAAAGDVAGDPTAASLGRNTPHALAALAAVVHGIPRMGVVPHEATRAGMAAPERMAAPPADFAQEPLGLEQIAADNMGPRENGIQARRVAADDLVTRAQDARVSRAIGDVRETNDIYDIGRQMTEEDTVLQGLRQGRLNDPDTVPSFNEPPPQVSPRGTAAPRLPPEAALDPNVVDIGELDAPPRAVASKPQPAPPQTTTDGEPPLRARPPEAQPVALSMKPRQRADGSVVFESEGPVWPKDDSVPAELTPRDKAEWWLRELDRRVVGDYEKNFTPEDRALMWRVIDGSETSAERDAFNGRSDMQTVTGNIIKAVKEQNEANHVTIGNRDPETHAPVDPRGTSSLDRAVSHIDTAVDEISRGATKRLHLDQPKMGRTTGPRDAIAGFRSSMAESAVRKFLETRKSNADVAVSVGKHALKEAAIRGLNQITGTGHMRTITQTIASIRRALKEGNK